MAAEGNPELDRAGLSETAKGRKMSTKRRCAYRKASEIVEAVDVAAVLRDLLPGVRPAPRPWVDGGLCPMHVDHHRGSFKVNFDTGRWICFSCGHKGDLIDLVRAVRGIAFREALEYLGDYR